MTELSFRKEFKFFFVENLSKRFGGVQAVDNFSMSLDSGEIVGLIGPNGAGKTTVFNLITGFDYPDTGEIYFSHQYIHQLPVHKRTLLGISRTFQNIRLLEHLSVIENVKIAYHSKISYTIFDAVFRLPRYHKIETDISKKCLEFLEIVGLTDIADMRASALPYGKRRKLELARALATEASLLLLDEPAAGLNTSETQELTNTIKFIRDEFKITILLIEHDMRMVMNLCDRIIVMNFGKIIAEGTPSEIQKNPAVIEAYLGYSADE
jgi:branched-chain amino acid transport system ATP-binding protein